MTLEELKQLAVSMLNKAYCPYSHFPVGAALECADGSVFTGVNIENASYPVGTCAERTAFGTAIAAGYRDFKRIVIATRTKNYSSPCGLCRQFMYEFSPDLEVICLNENGDAKVYTMRELLPGGFDMDNLKSRV